jgi:hypothetical protein
MARDEPKIGAGHPSAMFRQGLSELRGALYNQSNIAQPPQYGLYGTKTPGEVAESRRSDAELDEEKGTVLDSRMGESGPKRDEPGRSGKGMDRE